MFELHGQNLSGIPVASTCTLGQQTEDYQLQKCKGMGDPTTDLTPNEDISRARSSCNHGNREQDFILRSPIMTEHEHGLGASGLWRIRQQPPNSGPSHHASVLSSRKSSVKLQLSDDREELAGMPSGPPSPTSNFTEDLTRFPSESLHSFSFAHQSGEFICSRQNILKRSIDFMSQNLGWGSKRVGIACAQARANGDREAQGMLELLGKAQLVDSFNLSDMNQPCRKGALTGPPLAEEACNIFDLSFWNRRNDSDKIMDKTTLSLSTTKVTENPVSMPHLDIDNSRTHLEPTRDMLGSSPSVSRVQNLRRTYTDTNPLSLQNKLIDALAQPYLIGDNSEEKSALSMPQSYLGAPGPNILEPVVHGHSSRSTPVAQAIFTTESVAPYTILSANDLACLIFGVTKAEVRKMGILEVVREEGRAWLINKLESHGQAPTSSNRKATRPPPENQNPSVTNPFTTASLLLGRTGVTASLLSKPNSRQIQEQALNLSGKIRKNSGHMVDQKYIKGGIFHSRHSSRGVLLCGDVIPIQKRNGTIGSASLWVKEKRGSLIWVLEEIQKDEVIIGLDLDARIIKVNGPSDLIWGENTACIGIDIGQLLPRIPRQGIDGKSGSIDHAKVISQKYFVARNSNNINVPCFVDKMPDSNDLKVSSYPHIAGILVLSAQTLKITSSNSVFSAALFGQEKPDGKPVTDIIPDFERILKYLTDKDGIQLVDGIVIPEHSFRRAQAFLSLRDSIPNAISGLYKREGLPAKHRDGSEIMIDAQLRVVKSDAKFRVANNESVQSPEDTELEMPTELVYALWITYSRQIQLPGSRNNIISPTMSDVQPLHYQPTSGQTEIINPITIEAKEQIINQNKSPSNSMIFSQKTKDVNTNRLTTCDGLIPSSDGIKKNATEVLKSTLKKSIDDFVILEEMGQGAYGQVKLARYKKDMNQKMVLKYVTKRRILIDTWTRDRRLGTVPLEIHVLDYLRRDGLQHPNIIEMTDFFEDDKNYYIETLPHGLPGIDLFDYIELRANMGEVECRSIFVQVARAICHLHTKAAVVHRDIKDENVVLDGEGRIKLIDFGSAAYIKNGPFDVFVGTIDYAAPEVLAGTPYRGKEQDVWALGILLYTIVYKENPFYSIDEIMDRDLRIPHVMNEDNLDLIRVMLDRNVESRITIEGVLEHPWCKAIEKDL